MKSLKTGLMAVSVIAGSLNLSVLSLHAQILEKISLSATLYTQGATNDNTTTTTIKSPVKSTITTANLLKQLAADENFEGNWASNSFPSSAKLDFNGTGFEIDQGTNELLDVSDMLTWTVSGQNDITAGNFLDANGAPSAGQGTPPFNETDMYLVTIAYNSSGTGNGNLTFTATGLATLTEKAGSANATTGNYTESGTLSLSDGTGEGVDASGNFVMTGITITASGESTQNDGSGTDKKSRK